VATFVLVHGGFHGAWCWDLLRPELAARGHESVAVDLPISDPSATNADYAEVVSAAALGHDDVILVGHSLGGMTLPLVADRTPVRHLVFLAGAVPRPHEAFGDYVASHPAYLQLPLSSAETVNGCSVIQADVARRHFFHDCSPAITDWATSMLRPQSQNAMTEPYPLERWPGVESTYVICRHDRALDPAQCRLLASERLGIDIREIDGGHSPFLSRPAELADLLVAIRSRTSEETHN
jgi:pimeloyl-ACP methyl ester carboxylesterase